MQKENKMSYIKFDRSKLVNLEYSLHRELLRANRAGSYASTTIVNCNTRKYHGLLITPQPGIDHENHVLLSTIEDSVIQMDSEFNLGIHKYPGNIYSPHGHRYMVDFITEPIPRQVYRVGGAILSKEMIFTSNEDRMIIKYTLEEANYPTTIRIRPFLAFRNIHHLTKENITADKKYERIPNGIKVRMYEGYTELSMLSSESASASLVQFWRDLGGEPVTVSPDQHDEIVAHISHLPQVLASALCALLARKNPAWRNHAGGGLRDTTRIAASDPQLWRTILEQNRDELLRALQQYQDELHSLHAAIANRDWLEVVARLERGKAYRDQFRP